MNIDKRFLDQALLGTGIDELTNVSKQNKAAKAQEDFEAMAIYYKTILDGLPGRNLVNAYEIYGESFTDEIFPLLIDKLTLSRAQASYIAENLIRQFPLKLYPPMPKERDGFGPSDADSVDIRASLYAIHFEIIATAAAIRSRCRLTSEKDPASLLELLVVSLMRREHLALEWMLYRDQIPVQEGDEASAADDFNCPLVFDENEEIDTDCEENNLEAALPVMAAFERLLDFALESE